MKFREALLNDLKQITEFQLKMAFETEALELNRDTVVNGVEAVFSDAHKGKYYVVEDKGNIISSLLTTYEWSDWRNAWVVWIQSVYVLPEYRKQGVFKLMYEEVKSMVQENPNYTGIRLYVDRSNEKAIKVYEAMGMHGEHYRLFEDMI
jgi:GNAT superfamily N-acetyltransferase